MGFKVGDWVTEAGSGCEAHEITKVDEEKKRVVINGCWEPMHKCTLIPEDQHHRIFVKHFYYNP